MTNASTDASDLVELLRQRVQVALDASPVLDDDRVFDALQALARSDGAAVQAVARALLAPEGQTTTEWATYWGADSPEAAFHLLPLGPSGFVECEDREDAEELAKNHGAKIARRTVSRGPWQVVPGGES